MWFRVDDGFLRHPKVHAAADRLGGRNALGRVAAVWLECGLYSAATLTDGFIPNRELGRLATDERPLDVIQALVQAGLAQSREGGVALHDWHVYQPSAQEVKDKREWDARRKRLYSIPGLIEAIRGRDQNRCRYCNQAVNWRDRRGPGGGTYDHIIPRGDNSLQNVVVCCLRCNVRKGGRTPVEAGMELLPEPSPNQVGGTSSELDKNQNQAGSNHVADQRDPIPSRPPVEDQNQKEQRAAARDSHRVLVRLAHDVLDAVSTGTVDERDLSSELKTRAAKAQIAYDSESVRKALDSAEHQRVRQARTA